MHCDFLSHLYKKMQKWYLRNIKFGTLKVHNLKVLENYGVKSDLTARSDFLEGSQKKAS